MNNQIAFNETGHRELWQWLVENPMKIKENWPGWEDNGGTYNRARGSCFACEYDEEGCEDCPLVWSDEHCSTSGFAQWDNSLDPTERSTLAAQIRDLKVKPGVVCI